MPAPQPPLTLDELQDALDRLGADRSRWPRTLAARADALITDDLRARRVVAEADALVRLLNESQVASPGADLVGRILSRAPSPPPARPVDVPQGWWVRVTEALGLDLLGSGLRPAAALCGALVLGLGVGYGGDGLTALGAVTEISAEAIDGFALGLMDADGDVGALPSEAPS